MRTVDRFIRSPLLPAGLVAVTVLLLTLWWLGAGSGSRLKLRAPGADNAPGSDLGTNANAVLAGHLLRAEGKPGKSGGAWPQFRGGNRDGMTMGGSQLARKWPSPAPRELWSVEMGEGYAGPAVLDGRVYVMDYDQAKRQDALRCLSLEDGQEIWRYVYPVAVKRNHGMSRTVPAVTDKIVVGLGPKCHVVCLDPSSGELRWGLDLVKQYGATVPPWYAGQCPLVENGRVILAPGGKEALLVAVDGMTGKELWKTPNPRGWKMTHSSVMPMEVNGKRTYVYCANNGVVGVSADDGTLLWENTDWKISIATVPSPVPLAAGRVFLSGGYNAGSLMLEVVKDGEAFTTRTLFRLGSEVFGATQHTPVFYQNYLYGVRADGKFVCLDLDGKPAWVSGSSQQFGLGSFLLADGLIFAMNDSGLLRMFEAAPEKYNVLGEAQVLQGRESWGPLALAGGRLLARDLTRMVCLDVEKK